MPWSTAHLREFARRHTRIVRAVRGGLPVEDAADRFGVTSNRVYHVCRRAGLGFGADGEFGVKAAAGRVHRAIARAAAEGMACAQIASRFGVSATIVGYACRKHGVRLRRADHPTLTKTLASRAALRPNARALVAAIPVENAKRIAHLLLTTRLSMGQIGKACGTSRQRVHQVWKACNAPASA